MPADTAADGETIVGQSFWWIVGGVIGLVLVLAIVMWAGGFYKDWFGNTKTTAAQTSDEDKKRNEEFEKAKKEMDEKIQKERLLTSSFENALNAARPGAVGAAAPAPTKVSAQINSVKVDPGIQVLLVTEDHNELARAYVAETLDLKACWTAYLSAINNLPPEKRPNEDVIKNFERLFQSQGVKELFDICVTDVQASFTVEELKVLVVQNKRYPWMNTKVGMPRIYDNKRGTIGAKYLEMARTTPPSITPLIP